MAPSEAKDTATCERISELLARVGDKWTVLVVRVLGDQPMRFNALRRHIGDISQKMLATTLRSLERDGFVTRTVAPTTPPQVEYALTDLGRSLLEPVQALVMWTVANAERIEASRSAYAARAGAGATMDRAPGDASGDASGDRASGATATHGAAAATTRIFAAADLRANGGRDLSGL